VRRAYGDRPALVDISIRVAAGQTLGLFGPNGAGKTTLLRILATLLRPDSGSVSVLQSQLPDEAFKVRRRIGYLGHRPLLYPQLSARENLRFHARLNGIGDERVEELLVAVGMDLRATEPVSSLSQGMIQRLSVARAVLCDPPLLLLDEPRANLDPSAREATEPLIGKSPQRTRVIATHDIDAGLDECDIALGLRQGRQVLAGRCNVGEIQDLYRE
jgi:heme exporter protein A